jgi:hypothetical protein
MSENRSVAGGLRTVAAALVLATLAFTSMAATTNAQALVGGGMVSANAVCYPAGNRADVTVSVMNPQAFSASGLVYYTQLWAKLHSSGTWNLISQAQSPTINTWTVTRDSMGSPMLSNNSVAIFSGAFTGRYDGVYDIYIRYWDRTPTSTTWAGPFGFSVAGDGNSTLYTISYDAFGNLYQMLTSDCNL